MSEENTTPEATPVVEEAAQTIEDSWDAVTDLKPANEDDLAPEGEESEEEVTEDDNEGSEQEPREEDEEDISEDGESDSEDAEGTEEGEDKEDKTDQPERKIKTYKAKRSDGEVVEIADDTVIKLKANKKFRKVTVEDLKKAYASNVAHDERMADVVAREQQVEARLSETTLSSAKIQEHTRNVVEASSKADIFGALESIAELSGVEPMEFITTFMTGMAEFQDNYDSLDEVQQREYIANAKLNIKEKNLTKKETKITTDAQKATAKAQVEQAKADYGFTQSELEDGYRALATHAESIGKNPSTIKVKEVVDLMLDKRIYDNISIAQEDLGIEMDKAEQDYMFKLIKVEEEKEGSTLELQDYSDIMKAVSGNKASQANLSRKVQKGKNQRATPKRQTKQKQEIQVAPMDAWDSL